MKAIDLAYRGEFREIRSKSPILLALNMMGGPSQIHRLTVTDSRDRVQGVLSGLEVLDFLITERGDNIRDKCGGRLDRFLAEPAYVFMQEFVHRLSADIKLDSLLAYAIENDIGHIILVDRKEKLKGIITESCFISKLSRRRYGIPVSRIMTTPARTVEEDGTIIDAVKIMTKYKIRRLPIVRGGRLRAIITCSDILKSMYSADLNETMFKGIKMQELFQHRLEGIPVNMSSTLYGDEDLNRAVSMMVKQKTAFLPVLDKRNRLEGVITERDLVTRLPKEIGVDTFVKKLI